jgi:hypothetical protein
MKGIVRQILIHVASLALVFSLASGFPATPGAYMKGQVKSSNKPLRSVWVIVSQYGQEKGRSLTGDDGKYFIDNLSNGTYDVIVEQAKRQVWRGQKTIPSTNYDITVKPIAARR